MTGTLSRSFREEIMAASPEAIKLGISFEELSDSVTETVAQSGKFKLLSKDTIAEMALASKFTRDMKEFAGMAKDFERVGYGVLDMSKMIERMGLNSLTLGLNARETTAGIDKYLEKLNQYGFRNGVEGLNRMVQRSIEFRMNMENVFNLAEKVWDPDGALEIVANLQMIGGAYGDLNDPIRMMYMATNDVEGLQTAIIGAARSLVTYNAEQGRFEVTGANLRRAKEMAELFGMSMEELTSTGIAGMERLQASTDLALAGLVMEDDEKELNIRLNANTGDWDWDTLANEWDVQDLKVWGLEMPADWGGERVEAKEDDYEIPDEIETDIVVGDIFAAYLHVDNRPSAAALLRI